MKRKHRPSDLTAHAETSPRDSANKCNAPTSRDISPKGSTRSPLEDGYSTIARSPQDSPLLSKCKKRKKRNVDGGGNDKDDQLDAAGKMNSDGHSQQESRVEENSDQLNIKGRSSAGRETTRSEGCPNEAAVPEEKEEGAMEAQVDREAQSGVASASSQEPRRDEWDRKDKKKIKKMKKMKAREGAQEKVEGSAEGGSSGAGAGPRGGDGGAQSSRPSLLRPEGPGQGKPRKHTLSIALPGSVVENAQSRDLKAYLVGEIARAAAIFEVDEIVVYDDLSASRLGQGLVRDGSSNGFAGGDGGAHHKNDPNVFMARLLQYAETPQYLRRQLFPLQSSLRHAGLLNPLDAPHHMRAEDDCPYREGVVVDKEVKRGVGSFVDIGKRKEARIDRKLEKGVRVTVKLDQGGPSRKSYFGKAVAPSAPREELGLYWGYQTRLASGMADVLTGCPFRGGYDLTVGTSERGSVTVDSPTFGLPEYQHVLVVFGGVQGIEATVDADETLDLPGSDSSELFDMWVNTCPGQGSRTIRTEEAVLITLARLRPHILANRGSPCGKPSGSGGAGSARDMAVSESDGIATADGPG